MTGKYLPTFTLTDLVSVARDRGDGFTSLREQLGALYDARYVFLFRNARSALTALLQAVGGTGAAVIPAYNCIAVPEAVVSAGWRPTFVDVGEGDVNMTSETLARHLAEDARAVILTHQFGLPPAMEPILDICRQRKLLVIEDAAPAIGARYHQKAAGAFGDAAVISFHLTKIVGIGAAGALMTNQGALAERIAAWQMRDSGRGGSFSDFGKAALWWTATRPACYGLWRRARSWVKTEALYEVVSPAERALRNPCRPCSPFVARLASRQLKSLDENLAARKELAAIYRAGLAHLASIKTPPVPEAAEPAWMQYPIFVEDKAGCYHYLLRHGVDVNWTFRYSCAEGYQTRMPNAEKAARTLLGLPTYPGLPTQEARRICELLKGFGRN